jgi:hypothetical protein
MEAERKKLNKNLKDTHISSNSYETGMKVITIDTSSLNFVFHGNPNQMNHKRSKIGSKLSICEDKISEECFEVSLVFTT